MTFQESIGLEIQRTAERFGNAELFPEQRKQQREDDTDENGGSDRKVERELLFFNQDISRKPADPWNLLPNQ